MKPRDALEAIAELAQACAAGWDAYTATEAALGAPTMRSVSSDTGPIGGGDHSDPVLSQVLSHTRYYETVAEISEALGHLRAIQRTQSSVRRNHAETYDEVDAAVKAARCDGVVGEDPTCTRNAVGNVRKNGVLHQTCSACKKRDQRAQWEAAGPSQASA